MQLAIRNQGKPESEMAPVFFSSGFSVSIFFSPSHPLFVCDVASLFSGVTGLFLYR